MLDLSGRGLILILGMHRSGTSTVAALVNSVGAYMGEKLMPAGAANPKGFFEDTEVVALNDSILRHFNLTWSDSETISIRNQIVAMPEEFYRKAANILRRLYDNQLMVIAIKDPRMSRLLSFWQSVILPTNVKVKCVVSIRHPASIAASLLMRDRFDVIKAFDLWSRYMLECSAQMYPAWPRLMVDYDRIIASPGTEYVRVCDFLGADHSSEKFQKFLSFIDTDLRHQYTNTASKMEPHYQALWESLYAQALKLPSDNSKAALDA